MIGQYVRMTVPPYSTGTIKSARFHKGEANFLFQSDSRFTRTILELWLLDSELQQCQRPTDDDVAVMNQKATEGFR